MVWLRTQGVFETVGGAGGRRVPTTDLRLSRVLHGSACLPQNHAFIVSSFVPFGGSFMGLECILNECCKIFCSGRILLPSSYCICGATRGLDRHEPPVALLF